MFSLYLALVFLTTLSIAGPAEFVDSKRRQTPPPPPGIGPTSVPPQCQTTCQAPLTTVTVTCIPAVDACLCPPAVQKGLFDCFTCVGKAVNNNDFTIPQTTIDSLTVRCIADGHHLPKLTFPGQDANRALPTSSAATARTSAPAPPSVGQSPSKSQTSGIVTIQTSFPPTAPSQAPPPITVTATAPVTPTTTNNTSSPTSSSGAPNNPPNSGGTCAKDVKSSHFWFASVGTLLAVLWI